MMHNRRSFLNAAAAGVCWALTGACATPRPYVQQPLPRPREDRPIRRNLAELPANHPLLAAYAEAVAAMKALPSSDPRNWSNQARTHEEFCSHGNWLFLPWHRWYIAYFERICRELSGMPEFALPYWDWTREPRVPAAFWGGPTNPLFDASRLIGPDSRASAASVGPAVVEDILAEPNFLLFGGGAIPPLADRRLVSGYGNLEATPHNYIHGFVGGNMATFMSPLDPLFWLHHCMVDRIWAARHLVHGHRNPGDRSWLEREFTEFCDEHGRPVSVTVAESQELPLLDYRYDDLDDARVRARRGARAELEVTERALNYVRLVATVDKPGITRLKIDRLPTSPGVRILLVFEGVELDFTTDFSVRVFIDHPEAGPDTPLFDPHFVGAFSSFHHHDHQGRGSHPSTGRFVLDAGPTLARLGIERGPIDVTVVLVPYGDRPAGARALVLDHVELQLAR